MASKNKKEEIVEKYKAILKRTKRKPTRRDMLAEGITRDTIRHHFGSLQSIHNLMEKELPEYFKSTLEQVEISKEELINNIKKLKKYKRFIITSAVLGAPVFKEFYSSLKTYCKHNKALLVVLPIADPKAKSNWQLDPLLVDECLVVNSIALNDNLHISTIKIGAKQVDPTTGLARIGQRDGSFIFASPKQRLVYTPTGNKIPHALMSPGAITTPNYDSDIYLAERSAYIAAEDHVMGAIVVELDGPKRFHFRQVQAHKDGSFADYGVLYTPKRMLRYDPEGVVLGDYHSGDTDPVAERCALSIIKELKISKVVLHDFFDGASVNHHEEGNYIVQAFKAKEGKTSLEDELKRGVSDLTKFTKINTVKEVAIVKSNHDDFLNKYLSTAKYVEDKENHYLALKLAIAYLEGKDPLKAGYELMGLNSPKVKFLRMDEDYRIGGVQLGAHGHVGANGAKGSIVSLEKSYGAVTFGHVHSPQILRNAWAVGTLSVLRPRYVKGASSWVHNVCLHYPSGARQMINFIDGRYRGG